MEVNYRDILASLSILYDHLNSKQLSSLQPHEIIIVLSDENFLDIIYQIFVEIAQLEEIEGPSTENPLEWATSRGYLIPIDSEISTPENRARLLYEAMSDLMTIRIIKKRSLMRDIVLSSYKKSPAIEVIISSVETMNKALNLPYLTLTIETIPSAIHLINQSILDPSSLSHPYHLIPLSLEPQQYETAALITKCLNQEYKLRRHALSTRLNVTIGAFLWSEKCQNPESRSAVSAILQCSLEYQHESDRREFEIWDVLSVPRSLLSSEVAKVGYTEGTIKSLLKGVTIGTVPNRGGVPEGYSLQEVHDDVSKANQQLQQKSAREAAALKRSAEAASGGEQKKWHGTPERERGSPWNRGRGSPWNRGRGGIGRGRGGGGYDEADRRYVPEEVDQQQQQDDYDQQLQQSSSHWERKQSNPNYDQQYSSWQGRSPQGGRGKRGRGGFGGRSQDQSASATWNPSQRH